MARPNSTTQADVIRWSGGKDIRFFVKTKEVRGYKDLTISAEPETENKTEDGERYTQKKNTGAYEITFAAVLNAQLGVDVQTLALDMTEAARTGATGYFYIGKKKFLPSLFMATSAKISNIFMTGKGKWISCEVAFTLKQCSKYQYETTSTQTTGSGSRIYRVQIPGMAEVKVYAKSKQDAVTQAVGKNWTGSIYIDKKLHYVIKGTIVTTAAWNAYNNQDSFTEPIQEFAETVQDWINNFMGVQEEGQTAEEASQEVTDDANAPRGRGLQLKLKKK